MVREVEAYWVSWASATEQTPVAEDWRRKEADYDGAAPLEASV